LAEVLRAKEVLALISWGEHPLIIFFQLCNLCRRQLLGFGLETDGFSDAEEPKFR
jgi:hypothetical protein